jgi:hypothetical protein
MISILCKKNPVHYLLTYSFEIHFNLLPHTCHMPHLSPFSNSINRIIFIDKQNLDHHYHYHHHHLEHLNTIFLPSSLYYSSMCSPSPIWTMYLTKYRSQRQRGLSRRSSTFRLLRFWVGIPPGVSMFVCCECVCCQVEVFATDWSLVQRSPTDCGASLNVIKKPRKTRRLKPATGLWKYNHNGL